MRASYRIGFTDFITDPDDDCRRRAATIPADRITFADSHLILWIGDTERVRYPMEAIRSAEVVQFPGSRQRENPDQLRARYPNIGKPWSGTVDDKPLALHLASAALECLCHTYLELEWHTAGDHINNSEPFWTAAGEGVPGSYTQQEACHHAAP